MKAAQLLFGDEVGGAIVPEDDSRFPDQLARDVLNGTKLSDLQTLFADEMQVSNSPLGCLTETSPLMVPVLTASQTWEEWLNQHSSSRLKSNQGGSKKYRNINQPGQLPIWGSLKEG